jgi:hypothetical protein
MRRNTRNNHPAHKTKRVSRGEARKSAILALGRLFINGAESADGRWDNCSSEEAQNSGEDVHVDCVCGEACDQQGEGEAGHADDEEGFAAEDVGYFAEC